MRRFIAVLLCLVLTVPVTVPALASGPAPGDESNQRAPGLSRGSVTWPAAASALLLGTRIFLGGLWDSYTSGSSRDWILKSTFWGAHLPAYLGRPDYGLQLTGFIGGFSLLGDYHHDRGAGFWEDMMDQQAWDLALYSTYSAYRELRLRAAPGVYRDWRQDTRFYELGRLVGLADDGAAWKAHSFLDLAIAPLKGTYGFPYTMGLPVLVFLRTLIGADTAKAVWKTGDAYIGTTRFAPAVGVTLAALLLWVEATVVGVTEEAHFRGFIYEELAGSFGSLGAKFFDAVYFPAIHVPQERKEKTGVIVRNFLSRSALTFVLDWSYDAGGLPLSVTLHTLIDFSQFLALYMLNGGVPQATLEDMLGLKVRPITVAVSVPF